VLIPRDDDACSFEWLNGALESSADWHEGPIRVMRAKRIGETYGFSGRIHRVSVEAGSGRTVSLIVKEESAEAVERELLVRRHLGDSASSAIARCYAGTTDNVSGRGVLVLEDIAPAIQGDVLGGCTWKGAEAAVRALAQLHAATWMPGDDDYPPHLPRWPATPMDAERWRERLRRARHRFPDLLTAPVHARLRELPASVEASLAELSDTPVAWIHADAHLDNILWRLDGSAVLLDWCNATIGPPAVDVAICLSNGVPARWRQALISAYAGELERSGVDRAAIVAGTHVALALPHLLQGASAGPVAMTSLRRAVRGLSAARY
jgi:aminoglycoside phosphotransferase (APT) family kinase protein